MAEAATDELVTMMIGKRLLVLSMHDPRARDLLVSTAEWGCAVTAVETTDQLRGGIEGETYDMVLVDGAAALKRLIAEADPTGEVLGAPLAEIEKRHILRVLAAQGGNKTRAAKVLGIDTKTLYVRLKAYGAAAQLARRRQTSSNGDSPAI